MNLGDAIMNFPDFEPWPAKVEGWNGDAPIFGELVARLNPDVVIEVGCWLGQSTISLGKALKIDSRLFCVDTWLGALEFMEAGSPRDLLMKWGYPSVYYQWLSNVIHAGIANKITPVPQTSLIAARWLAKKGIRAKLIYLDASHEEPDVAADLRAYWPLVEPGGVLFGDDFTKFWPGVEKAVRAFAVAENLKLEVWNSQFWKFERS